MVRPRLSPPSASAIQEMVPPPRERERPGSAVTGNVSARPARPSAPRSVSRASSCARRSASDPFRVSNSSLAAPGKKQPQRAVRAAQGGEEAGQARLASACGPGEPAEAQAPRSPIRWFERLGYAPKSHLRGLCGARTLSKSCGTIGKEPDPKWEPQD